MSFSAANMQFSGAGGTCPVPLAYHQTRWIKKGQKNMQFEKICKKSMLLC